MRINADELQKIMDLKTETGGECGCQLVIFQKGKKVLDLVSGYTSPERNQKVNSQHLFPLYSCGKALVSTAVHILAEKGILSYEDRISDHWKEFGQNGKSEIRLWQLLSHRSGLHQLPEPLSREDLTDWKKMCRVVENMTPEWTPGTKTGYQAVSYAWLIGETVYRASGRQLKDVIREEILLPLGIENDCVFGTAETNESRCVEIDSSDFPGNTCWCKEMLELPLRRSFIPSFNGLATASAMAKFISSLAVPTDGVRLLKESTLANAVKLCRWAGDPIPEGGTWDLFGLGYVISGKDHKEFFGHGGACGGEIFYHWESGSAIAYLNNRPLVTHPDHPIRSLLSESLGLTPRVW